MNQIKIGKFIAECRKAQNLTQMQLAEKLNITDKAISKWERGDGLPDAYIISKMCELFGVSVDYMITPHSEQDRKVETKPIKKTKKIISSAKTSERASAPSCL